MPNVISLTCPTCGGKLEIPPSIENFACGYCGTEHVVKRGGGIVAIEPVIHGLSKIQKGTDKTASELAIKRLREEIDSLEHKLWNLLADEFTKEQSLMEMVRGKNNPHHVHWLYGTIWRLRKSKGNKTKWCNEDRDKLELIYHSPIEELEEVIDFAPKIHKKSHKGIQNLAYRVIEIKREIRKRDQEVKRHEQIVRL